MSNLNSKNLIPLADCHMHFVSQEICDEMIAKIPAEALGGLEPILADGKGVIEQLDRAGIQKAFVLSNAYGWGMDFLNVGAEEYERARFENNFAAEQAALYPRRLVPFLSIHPLKEYAIAEIDRCVDELHMVGLKLHFTNSDVDLRKPEQLARVKEVLAHTAKRGLPVLIHFRSRNPEFDKTDMQIFLNEILAALPTLKVQLAHLGDWGGYSPVTRDTLETLIEAFETNPALDKSRIYLDISGVLLDKPMGPLQPATEEELKQLVELLRRWGMDHLLWGSDWFAAEPDAYLQFMLEKLPLTEDEYKLLFSNAAEDFFA